MKSDRQAFWHHRKGIERTTNSLKKIATLACRARNPKNYVRAILRNAKKKVRKPKRTNGS